MVLLDQKRVLPCAAYLEGEYGVSGIYMGVPVLLGARGVEKIFELDLAPDERALLGRIGRASAMTSELLRRSRTVVSRLRSQDFRVSRLVRC